MTRVNIAAVLEHLLGVDGADSDEKLKMLAEAVKSSPEIRDMPISKLAGIAQGIQKQHEKANPVTP